MEVLFENRYERDKAMVKEVCRFLYITRKRIVVLDILLLIAGALGLLVAFLDPSYNWGVLFVIPGYFAVQLLCYFSQVKAITRRDQEICGKPDRVEISVTRDYVRISDVTGADYRLEYEKFKKGYQTKNLIMLQTKAKTLYIFPKATFTKGNGEDFVAFLKTKGIKI